MFDSLASRSSQVSALRPLAAARREICCASSRVPVSRTSTPPFPADEGAPPAPSRCDTSERALWKLRARAVSAPAPLDPDGFEEPRTRASASSKTGSATSSKPPPARDASPAPARCCRMAATTEAEGATTDSFVFRR
jgi:hypothetical protein